MLRETFLRVFGPGLFTGASFRAWVRLLRENRFVVSPRYFPRLASATAGSLLNSALRRFEERRYGAEVARVELPPPLFVLGHWRSGTTHLHNLLACDDRFAFPNLYQVLYPETFLTTEAAASRWTSGILPRTRVGLDNVRLAWDAPYEDEFVMATTSFTSPYVGLAFPRRQEHYDRFLTLRDASREEVEAWKRSLTWFLKKLTWKHGKPLVLKSPPHTCRIRLLLEMFPEARFVHIHRHPFAVYRSTKHMVDVATGFWSLQDLRAFDGEQRIVRQYREMFDAYFEERTLIPEGRLSELRFEDLDRDPIAELRRIYEKLGLGEFAAVEPRFREYLRSISGYRKNVFPEPGEAVRERLVREWRRSFDELGYAPSLEVLPEEAAGDR